MNCAELDDLAGELALGLVEGPTRAAALAHIESCSRCRAVVDELSSAADELVLLAPSIEPPVGFEARVASRIVSAGPVAGRRRRARVLLASAAALLLLGGAVAVGRVSGSPTFMEATMRTAGGQVVGDAYLHPGKPGWLFVAVSGWTDRAAGGAPTTYTVRITLRDGTSRDLPGGDLDGGRGGWGAMLDVDPSSVRAVALVGKDGRVWCSGSVA